MRASPPVTDFEDRLAGVLLGTAVGDALGLPSEGMSARAVARRFPDFRRYRFLGSAGVVSDDTEQTALVAESLLDANGDPARFVARFRKELLRWFLRLPWGIGLGTLKACLRIAVGLQQSGANSAGNGAAMRAAIVGVFFHGDTERRRAWSDAVARVTHRDTRAVEGARYVAELASLAAGHDGAADREARAHRHLLRPRRVLAESHRSGLGTPSGDDRRRGRREPRQFGLRPSHARAVHVRVRALRRRSWRCHGPGDPRRWRHGLYRRPRGCLGGRAARRGRAPTEPDCGALRSEQRTSRQLRRAKPPSCPGEGARRGPPLDGLLLGLSLLPSQRVAHARRHGPRPPRGPLSPPPMTRPRKRPSPAPPRHSTARSAGPDEAAFLARYRPGDFRAAFGHRRHRGLQHPRRRAARALGAPRRAPVQGRWALPGGFVRVGDGHKDQGEDLAAAGARELQEETSLHPNDVFLEQVGAFGRAGRDPRMRVITVAYTALIRPDLVPLVHAGGDAAVAEWHAVDRLGHGQLELAFDHAEIIERATAHVAARIDGSSIARSLVPKTFTIQELRQVHALLLGTHLDPGNFRRKFERLLEDGVVVRAAGKRLTASKPALVYRFTDAGAPSPNAAKDTL
ncbi:MAG: ADP-ribosylglycohydrolase family protein [Myxococcales bacterium]|nr:ADP-ribosylglycohydrolase family protein [Myxococcales bacterium]